MNTVCEKIAKRIKTLDAAGFGLVVLRCGSDYDIRSIVRLAFENKHTDECKLFEATSQNSCKSFDRSFRWSSHQAQNHSEAPSLIDFLSYTNADPNGFDRQILFIPDIKYLLGTEEKPSEFRNLYISLIKDSCRQKKLHRLNWLIIVGSSDGYICDELSDCSYIIDVPCPEPEEIKNIICDICQECYGQRNLIRNSRLNMLAEVMRGLRYENIRDILYLAFASEENPAAGDSEAIFVAARQAKKQMIKNVKGLSWVDPSGTKVGGLYGLSDFIKERRTIFAYPHLAKKNCADIVKGILVCGLPGSGKTTMAKLAAILLGPQNAPLPLVRLDVSKFQSKWYGESQMHCEKALKTIESIAPCVVIIDEIEKAFGSMSGDNPHETSQQIFQMVLDWMQEKREKPVFVFATANKTDRLPPELKRKGRFDEVFFAGIPSAAECRLIFNVHIKNKAAVIDFEGENEKSVYSELSRQFISKAAVLKRFLNGADIESIINSAFSELLNNALEGKSEQQLIEISDSDEPIRFTRQQIIDALENQLRYTRTYFNNNMDTTLEFIRNMYERDFRDASISEKREDRSSLPVLPPERAYFDRKTSMFNLEEMSKSGYLDTQLSCKNFSDWKNKTQYKKIIDEQALYSNDYDSRFRWTVIKEFFLSNE